MKPSEFAKLGNPSCSCFRKSELEWLALDYVKARVFSKILQPLSALPWYRTSG